MTILEWLTSKVRLRWLGAKTHEMKPYPDDDDFVATLREMQEVGWVIRQLNENSAILSFGNEDKETVVIER